MRVILPLIAAVAVLSACNMPDDTPALLAPVGDPYTTTADGVAVYQGNVNVPGNRLPGTASLGAASDFATAGATVYFAETQATLSEEARATLAKQAEWLALNPTYTAVIEGHADEPGTREFNLALGARRATAVQEYLVARGVASGRIRTISYGKERPAAICAGEPTCLARNRRAITIVSQSQAGA